jgi:glutaredoxin
MTEAATVLEQRPRVSVYWKPGCSSCLKLKEFVEEQNIPFESVNLEETPDRLDEVVQAGLRSIPVVRRDKEYRYAQSMDDVAAFLGVERRHLRMSQQALLDRWEAVLKQCRTVVDDFDEAVLARSAIRMRARPIRDLCAHVYQIADAFLQSVTDGVEDTRPLIKVREDIQNREQLLTYVDATIEALRAWRRTGGVLPAELVTYYGRQPTDVVLERAVWHSAQHARQLDVVAAGSGAEFQIPPSLYEGLPMPVRLWA